MARLHVWVEGRVQGVFFRDSTRVVAVDLGLTGWVKNLADGRVEAVFEGEPSVCEQALAYIRQGPPQSRVTRVHVTWDEEEESFDNFNVRY